MQHLSNLLFYTQAAVTEIWYRIVGKFGGQNFVKFGESFIISQTKTIQIST